MVFGKKIYTTVSSKHPEEDINELIGGQISTLHASGKKVINTANEIPELFELRLGDEIAFSRGIALNGEVSIFHGKNETTLKYLNAGIEGFAVDFGEDRVFVNWKGDIAPNQPNREEMVEKYQDKLHDVFPLKYNDVSMESKRNLVNPLGAVGMERSEIDEMFKERDLGMDDDLDNYGR